jgi:hypothetical protein
MLWFSSAGNQILLAMITSHSEHPAVSPTCSVWTLSTQEAKPTDSNVIVEGWMLFD